MITFFDLLQQDEYRALVSKRLLLASNTAYSFPEILPKLYQYKPLSKYAIDDICSGQITATSIGEFNDLFDGAFHRYGTEKERMVAAEKEWDKLESLCKTAKISDLGIEHDYYVGLFKNYYKTDSRLKFRMLDYLGTYVSCFSSENDSVLMWSHYAKSNTGICVEYDFNNLPVNHLLTKSIFPVRYTDSPVVLTDLLDDEDQTIFSYPLETAVLCAALNKATIWSYENEWRLVWVLALMKNMPRHLPLKITILPTRIYFGYHFLRPLFYYSSNNEYEQAKINIEQLWRLVEYMDKNNIPMSVMMPCVGQYSLKPIEVSIVRMKKFLIQIFDDNEPEDIRYYHIVHDELKELLERVDRQNFA